MKDPKRLKEFIIENIDMSSVMIDYGVDFVYDPSLSDETQYRCPFHGRDVKPSSRFYRSTKSSYCWVCKKKWDVISFIMDKENLSFIKAMNYLINRYGIDVSSIPDDPDIRIYAPSMDWITKDLISTKSKIMGLKGKLPLEKYSALCTAWYMISIAISKGLDVTESFKKLNSKLQEIL